MFSLGFHLSLVALDSACWAALCAAFFSFVFLFGDALLAMRQRLSGDNVAVIGSNIGAVGNVGIQALDNIVIGAGTGTSTASASASQESIGIGFTADSNSVGVFAGLTATSADQQTTTQEVLGSSIAAGEGGGSSDGPDPLSASQGETSSWGVQGSYTDQDCKQTNFATVGEGTVTVTSDDAASQQAVEEVNRDTSTAQVVIKDESTEVDLYVTDTGLDALANVATEDDPNTQENENTFGNWADLLGDYKQNTARQFIQLGEMSEALSNSEDATAQFAGAILTATNATLDALGTFTLGAVPSAKNEGGLVTQIPALVFGDQQNNVVSVQLDYSVDPETGKETFKIAENGFVVEGKAVDISTLPDDVRYAFVNGIQNTLEQAARNGAMQTGSEKILISHNPQHGFLADMIESGWDKTIGKLFPSGNARQIGKTFEELSKLGRDFGVAGHSQGGLLIQTALNWMEAGALAPAGDGAGNFQFQISGAPVSTDEFVAAVNRATEDQESEAFTGHNINYGDPVPNVLGGNFKDTRELLDSILNVAKLMNSTTSPHSDYKCVGDFCDDKQPGIDGSATRGP